MLAHNVYFTLHDDSEAAQQALVKACRTHLADHPGMQHFFVGRRKTEFQREVNDLDFHVALNIVFEDRTSHDGYQTAERHFKFIEENQENWSQVRVFDSEF